MSTQPLPNSGISSKDYLASLQQSSNPKAGAPSTQMGQADFLRLLTTQMQNQDPSKPMDPTSFVTDLTQMSQLQAQQESNKSILAMTKSFQSIQTLQGAALIGKNVQAKGTEMSHQKGQSTDFTLDLKQPLKDVKVVITDKNGPVKEIALGDLTTGEQPVTWDGLDDSGVSRDSGQYSLTVYGTDQNGDIQSIDSIVPSQVKSVGVNSDGTMSVKLATGEKVSLDAIREISG